MCRFIIVERDRNSESAALPLIVGEHEAEGTAREAAEEFAAHRPASRFEVFQLTGSAELNPRVEWKGARP